MVETTLRGTEAQIEVQGWDQPNRLFWLARASCGCIEVREPTKLTANLGRYYAPAVLQRITAGITGGGQLPAGLAGEWYGWLLAEESWFAVSDPGDVARVAELEADLAAGRIDRRADRQEGRSTYLGTRDGAELLLVRIRGQSPRLYGTYWPPNRGGADPTALEFQHLVTATVDRLGRG